MVLLSVLHYCFCFFFTAACEKEGTAEKAGKEAVRALDSAKKKINEATK